MPSLEESRKILDKNYYGFVHYNRQRKHILKSLVNLHRYQLLQMIPLLLHINDRRAPGYVAELGTNPGVHAFQLTDEIRDLRKAFISNRFVTSVGTTDNPLIVSIASIGSAGTLAQTEKSDFDLWITLRSDVKPFVYHQVRDKCDQIIEWLISQDPEIDVNLYMGTPAKIRNHDFGAVSDDSAGSALGKLLKEEFYRTCVNWCGKVPIWWIVPHEVRSIAEYQWWVNRIDELDMPYKEDLMDMGPIERASDSALLSSVLWQTNKSLASPFKSLLKLTVVSRYASQKDEVDTLADRVRRAVQLNPTMGRGTDPYLALFDFSAQYWRNERNEDAVALMAEMFYLKMLSENGSRFGVANVDETLFRKRSEVRTLLNGWGLTAKATRDLANINYWPFEKAMAYRAKTQFFVKFIYDRVMVRLEELGLKLEKGQVIRLREDVDEAAATLLSEFSTISYKVDAFYGRSWIKVEPSPPSFRKMLHQQGFAIIGQSASPKHERWVLSEEVPLFAPKEEKEKEKPEPDEEQETYEEGFNPETLVKSRTPLHIVLWLAVNKLLKRRSMLRVRANGTRRAAADVRRLVSDLADHFEHPLYDDKFPESEFNIAPRPLKAMIFFDMQRSGLFRFFGDDVVIDAQHDKDHLSTTLHRGTIQRIAYAEQSTHGLVRVYDVPTTRVPVAAIVARILRIVDGEHRNAIDERIMIEVANTRSHEDWLPVFNADLRRIHALMSSVPKTPNFALRVVTRVNNRMAIFTRKGINDYQGRAVDSVTDLLKELEMPLAMPVQTIVDEEVQGLERLRTMMKAWVPGSVRVFAYPRGGLSSIHVIDEAGGFFNERVSTERLELEVAGMRAFLHALRHVRRPFLSAGPQPFSLYKMRNDLAQQGGYHYVTDAMDGRDTRALDRAPLLKVSIEGESAAIGPVKVVTLTASGQQHLFDFEGPNWMRELAATLAALLRHQRLADFSLARINFTKLAVPLYQTLSHLKLRRRIEGSLREQMRSIMQAVSNTQVRIANKTGDEPVHSTSSLATEEVLPPSDADDTAIRAKNDESDEVLGDTELIAAASEGGLLLKESAPIVAQPELEANSEMGSDVSAEADAAETQDQLTI